MKTQHQNLKSIPEVFLFINSASGGGVGRDLLSMNVKQLQLDVHPSQHPVDLNNLVLVTLNLFDMKNDEQRKEGFTILAKTVQEERKVILVICGGDGTVMWVVTELQTFNIDHSKVPIAMLPLGTGNDFSQILGWGKECSSDLLDDQFSLLKQTVSYWFSAIQQNLDIWMTEAEVQQYGKLEKVFEQKNKELEGKTFTKHWCNYFSVGIDGKIGYSFDKHRTSSRLGNMAVYGVMGFVKSFSKTKTLGDLTNRLSEQTVQDDSPQQIQLIMKKENKPKETVILSRNSQQLQDIKNNQNMLFLNIDSYLGGVKDIWKSASLTSSIREENILQQSYSDGKVEVMSFGGAWSLGFEKSIGGLAKKLYQGGGPFVLQFNEFPKEEKHRTYLQIDGQYIRYTHPKKLTVRKSTLSRTGQIRILKRVPLQTQKNCCGCF